MFKLLKINNLSIEKKLFYFLPIFLPGIFGLIILIFKKFPVYKNGYDETVYLSWGFANH